MVERKELQVLTTPLPVWWWAKGLFRVDVFYFSSSCVQPFVRLKVSVVILLLLIFILHASTGISSAQ